MTQDVNLNLNHADCLRSVSDFGKTTVHNICTGTTSEVPWGSLDWTVIVTVLFAGAAVVVFFFVMFISLIRMR